MADLKRRLEQISIICVLSLLALLSSCDLPLPTDSPLPSPSPIVVPEQLSYYTYLPFVTRYREAMLENPSFEGGQWQENRYWEWPWRQVYTGKFNEVRPPIGWTAWWVERMFCPHNEDFKTGRPEVTLIFDYVDPLRLSDGDQAAKWFTFFLCHYGGLYQRVNVQPGRYQFSIDAHYWYSGCSTQPHGPPLQDDCVTPIGPWDYATIEVGIDPTGGEYYDSVDTVWSQTYEIFGTYGERLYSPVIETAGGWITVWVRGIARQPLKHDDLYLDDARLEEIQ